MKKARLQAEDKDLIPQADIYRQGQLIATLLIIGDREQADRSLFLAINGYAADQVFILWDTYFASSSDQAPSNYQVGRLARMFRSDDPAERAEVTEALVLTAFRRKGDAVGFEYCVAPYIFDAKRQKHRWLKVISDQKLEGFITESVLDAFSYVGSVDAVAAAVVGGPGEADWRFAMDIAATSTLVDNGAAVMLMCRTDEEEARLREVLAKQNGGVRVKRL